MKIKLQISEQPDAQSAAAEAGEYLNQILAENQKTPILLLLSAGSALAILDYVGTSALGANLTISMLDERYTPFENLNRVENRLLGVDNRGSDSAADHTDELGVNNFLQLQKKDFYNDALDAESSFFGTLVRKGESMEDLRQRWEKNLKAWREENPDGLIIATLGMGKDGHTAGIFPYPENPAQFKKLFGGNNWTVGYEALGKHKYAQRVTVTPEFFKLIDFGLGLVCGRDKKDKLELLIAKKTLPAELPAMAWCEIKNLKVFTDIKQQS